MDTVATDNIIVAEDYDGVFVDDVSGGFKALLREDGKKNALLRKIEFDGFKELGYQLLKTNAFSRFVSSHLPTNMGPRPEALEILEIAQGFGAELMLLTSNPRLDLGAFEHEAGKRGLKIDAVFVANPMDKGMVLDAMSNGKKLLFEDDPAVAQRAALHRNIDVGIVRESYNSIGSRLVSANPRVHRMNDWSEAISLSRSFAQSNSANVQGQKQKSV